MLSDIQKKKYHQIGLDFINDYISINKSIRTKFDKMKPLFIKSLFALENAMSSVEEIKTCIGEGLQEGFDNWTKGPLDETPTSWSN